MSKPVPDFIIEAAQVAVMLPPFKTVEEAGNAIDRIALALSQAYSRGLEDAARVALSAGPEHYAKGHPGFERDNVELEVFIATKIRALGSK